MTIEEYCYRICKQRPTKVQLDIMKKLEEIRNDGYQKGYADGVEEGEKKMSGIIIRNVITSLEEIKNGDGILDDYIVQLYEQVIMQMKGTER